jgi:hypothetical protein
MSEETSDPMAEVRAMGAVADALKGLDRDAVARVLQWAAGSFGATVAVGKQGTVLSGGAKQDPQNASSESVAAAFESLADLYAATQPKVDSDRALVAGYWFQFKEGQEDFASQTLNTALKNLGHGVSNITSALEALKGQSPALVMQIRKSGTSKQARKKYKLTAAGKRAIERLLAEGQVE